MIIFVRHGQTDCNIQKIMCGGGLDVTLNETGLAQVKELRKTMKNFEIDLVISSPMTRTLQTAREILHDRKDVPLFLDDRIVERKWEKFEGHTSTAELDKKLFTIGAQIPDEFKKSPFESLEDMECRLRDFWKDVEKKCEGKTVVVVGHDGVARLSRMIFGEIPKDGDLTALSVENATPIILKK